MLRAAVGGRDPAVGAQAAPAAAGRLLRPCLCAGYRRVVVVSLQANTEALTAQGEPYGMRSLCPILPRKGGSRDLMGAGRDREHPAASLQGQRDPPLKPRSPARRRAVSRIKTHGSAPIPQLPPLAAVRRGGAAVL